MMTDEWLKVHMTRGSVHEMEMIHLTSKPPTFSRNSSVWCSIMFTWYITLLHKVSAYCDRQSPSSKIAWIACLECYSQMDTHTFNLCNKNKCKCLGNRYVSSFRYIKKQDKHICSLQTMGFSFWCLASFSTQRNQFWIARVAVLACSIH